jgi:hypothetical protein
LTEIGICCSGQLNGAKIAKTKCRKYGEKYYYLQYICETTTPDSLFPKSLFPNVQLQLILATPIPLRSISDVDV